MNTKNDINPSTATATAVTLSASVRACIDHWLLRYPPDQKRSGILYALHVVQDENGGWLSMELINAVADYLDIPRVTAYEVATFYSLYHLQPVGKHVIYFCRHLSCMLCGADALFSHLKKRLGIELNETTPDGQFTLCEAECLGACIAAPACQINRQYYERLTENKLDDILTTLSSSTDGYA